MGGERNRWWLVTMFFLFFFYIFSNLPILCIFFSIFWRQTPYLFSFLFLFVKKIWAMYLLNSQKWMQLHMFTWERKKESFISYMTISLRISGMRTFYLFTFRLMFISLLFWQCCALWFSLFLLVDLINFQGFWIESFI